MIHDTIVAGQVQNGGRDGHSRCCPVAVVGRCGLWPRARYAEIPGAYVLSPLDEPEAVAREMAQFLTSTRVRD
jgi:pimeloyl-ACP methyl ester carboxylesterase